MKRGVTMNSKISIKIIAVLLMVLMLISGCGKTVEQKTGTQTNKHWVSESELKLMMAL